jgi:HK97 family phage portal protein
MGFVRAVPAGREQRSLTFIAPPIGAYTQALQDYAAGDIEGAMRHRAVWSCCDLIASMVSMMVPSAYKGRGIGGGPAALVAEQPDILVQPSADADIADHIYMGTMSALLRGNMYGRILERGAFGLPTQIELEHPDRVKVIQDRKGQMIYKYGEEEVPPDQVWHRAIYRMPGVRTGLSPIKYHQHTVRGGLSAQRFGNQWFDDGGHPSGILTNDTAKIVSSDDALTIKQRFLAAVHGTREPVVMGGGWKYQQIQISPDESQFLNTMKYSTAEVAGIFLVPADLVNAAVEGSAITYANVEQRAAHFLTFCLQRWISFWERIQTQLLPPSQFAKMDTSPLLRTDALTRWQIHHMQVGARIMTQDEIRVTEDLPPLTAAQRAELDALVLPEPPPIGSPKIGS